MADMSSEKHRARGPTPEFPEVPDSGTLPPYFLPRLLRTAVVVSPRAPYWDWAAACPSRHLNARPGSWADTVFLIPGGGDDSAWQTAYVEGHSHLIIAEMLAYITRIIDDWPGDRTPLLFREWFSVRFHRPIADLAGVPIQVTTKAN